MKKVDYFDKYKEIYKAIPEKDQKKADELIMKLADVLEMMDECKEHIKKDGCVSSMCQGSYSIDRENPWSRVYDAKTKLMISLLDKLDKLLPDNKESATAKAGENLAKYVAGGKPIEIR